MTYGNTSGSGVFLVVTGQLDMPYHIAPGNQHDKNFLGTSITVQNLVTVFHRRTLLAVHSQK